MPIIESCSRGWLSFQFLLSASFLLLLVIAPTVGAVSAPSSNESDLQWLHVNGHSIIREDGAVIILRGANVPQLARSGETLDQYEAYLDTAKSMGYNVIRLPISWAELEPSLGKFSSAYLDSLKKIVDLAGEKKMYVVVDMHQSKTDGFPPWILPKLENSEEAAAGFWRSSASQLELVKAWKSLASLLKDRSPVAGYDLLNEPYGGTIAWQDFAPILNEFYSGLISEIRNVDVKHIVFFEPTEGVCILGQHIALRPSGMNLAFSPHFYVSGPADYLNNVAQQLYNLTVNTWNIPLWIGEFGGDRVDVTKADSLHSLAVVLDLFDQYSLGWAYCALSETNAGPRLVDQNGRASASLTRIMTRMFPLSYAADDVTFIYNSTRFQLNASANRVGLIDVSVPSGFQSIVPRCINCDVTEDDDQHSITINVPANRTAYFYLDQPDTISRLQKLAESEFDRALQTLDELRGTVFNSSLCREYLGEMQDVVDSMRGNLTAEHYEFVIDDFYRVERLKTLAFQEEENYARAELFVVNSIRQDMLGSQGNVVKWQLVLLTQAYENLYQGNYTSAAESARRANEVPRKPAPSNEDPAIAGVLSITSLVLLGMVVVPAVFLTLSRKDH